MVDIMQVDKVRFFLLQVEDQTTGAGVRVALFSAENAVANLTASFLQFRLNGKSGGNSRRKVTIGKAAGASCFQATVIKSCCQFSRAATAAGNIDLYDFFHFYPSLSAWRKFCQLICSDSFVRYVLP